MLQERIIKSFALLVMLAVLTAIVATVFTLSSRYRAQERVRDACINASAAGKTAQDNGDENYGLAYWSLLIDELERAAKLDSEYFEVLEGAIVTRAALAGNETMSGDFEMENYVKVNATCSVLTK